MNLLSLLKPILNWHIRNLSKKSLPDYNQSYKLAGLQKKVTITRDRWAVPHIQAENEWDLFFAQGFAHAQDRLWQMEMNRRVASGRLSELFGKIALDSDRISRTLGFRRLAESDWNRYKNHDIAKVGEAYAAGVNAFLAQCKKLPAEFKLLGIKPEPWSVVDSLAYGRFICFRMSYGWAQEIEHVRLAAEVGIDKLKELYPAYHQSNPVVLPKGIETFRIVDGRFEAFQGPFLPPIGGSNNWAVAAHLMENGSAVLCNDPHLALNMPNIWYENHLICPELEVTGVSLLGVPMVLIGHNRHIAWGATLSFVDLQDTYVEQFTNESCEAYQHGSKVLPSRFVEEKIHIKKQKNPHLEKVIYTQHGPIISDIVGKADMKISLQSQCLKEDNDMMLGFYGLNKAGNWNEFVESCSRIEAPSLNLAYADTDNNIGYYVTGSVPIRKKEEDLFPRQGWLSDYEWTGYVPFREMPHALNPAVGYVFSCNNKVVDDDYPHDLGDCWMNGYRANRLNQLFEKQATYTLEDFQAWQMDFYCIPGIQFVEMFKKEVLNSDKQSLLAALAPNVKKTIEAFVNWDGMLTKDSVGGCIYQVLKRSLIELIIGEELSEHQIAIIRGRGPNPPLLQDNEFWGHDTTTLLRMLENPELSSWLKTTADVAFVKAMERATTYLEEKLGKDQSAWKWGKLHQMCLLHVMGIQKPLDAILNIDKIEMGGDSDTLCQVNFEPGAEGYGGTLVAASYRQIIDMGDFSKAKCISPIGQSGNLLSPHRNDQLEMWLRGEYKPMVWTEAQIDAYKMYRCMLD